MRITRGSSLMVRASGEYRNFASLPPVTPSTLERGFDALDQARLAAERALARPPQRFEEA